MRFSTMHNRAGRIRKYAHLVGSIAAVLLMLPTAFAGQDSEPPVSVIGYFSNMRFTEEHAYGYSVELWRRRDTFLGLFFASEGLQGDTPTGLLEDVKFDTKTGELSFRAKLSIGVVYSKEHDGVPSRDLFVFAGVLTKNRLAGTLKRLDGLRPQAAPRIEKLALTRSKSNQGMEPFKSLDDWKKAVKEILKFRGPKWE
jgi:hypothetical protein